MLDCGAFLCVFRDRQKTVQANIQDWTLLYNAHQWRKYLAVFKLDHGLELTGNCQCNNNMFFETWNIKWFWSGFVGGSQGASLTMKSTIVNNSLLWSVYRNVIIEQVDDIYAVPCRVCSILTNFVLRSLKIVVNHHDKLQNGCWIWTTTMDADSASRADCCRNEITSTKFRRFATTSR